MKKSERIRGILRAPKLLWDVCCRGSYAFNYDMMPMVARRMSLKKRVNLALSGLNLLCRKALPWSMPLHLQFELTNYCNLKCPVCPTGSGIMKRPRASMAPEVFEQLLGETAPYLLTLSLWAWGEPLLHPRLREILEIADRYDTITLLSTNGQMLGAAGVQNALLDFPPKYLIVALDGLTDATNSIFRVGAKLAPALAGVREIARQKSLRKQLFPILHMRYIPMKHNQHEVGQLTDFARRHLFDMLTIRTLSIIDTGPAEIDSHSKYLPDGDALKAYAYHGDARIRRRDYVCQQPFWFPAVYADGTVVACEQDHEAQVPLGSLSETGSFKKIWYSRHAQTKRLLVRDHKENLSFCINCPYIDRLAEHCSIESFFLNNTIEFQRLPFTRKERQAVSARG